MSDDRLFASNGAIGRKWYFLNLIFLSGITYGINYFFNNYILENVKTEDYSFIAHFIEGFVYLLLFITFLSLIDRRLYDITGDRSSNSYRTVSSIIVLCFFIQIALLVSINTNFTLPITEAMAKQLSLISAGIFGVILIVLSMIKGQIANLSYEQYRKKMKYQ